MTVLITAPLVFIAGIVAYAVLHWISQGVASFKGWDANLGTAWLLVTFVILIDVFYVIARVGGLHLVGLDGSTPVVIEGFLHWIVFSIGMGTAAYVAGLWSRRG